MKRLTQKLRSRSGETLTEMLVSIVILGLSIAMMVTMIITSTHLTEQSSAKDKGYQNQLSAAERQDGFDNNGESITVDNGIVSIKMAGVEDPVNIDVKVFGNAGELKSYRLPKDGE